MWKSGTDVSNVLKTVTGKDWWVLFPSSASHICPRIGSQEKNKPPKPSILWVFHHKPAPHNVVWDEGRSNYWREFGDSFYYALHSHGRWPPQSQLEHVRIKVTLLVKVWKLNEERGRIVGRIGWRSDQICEVTWTITNEVGWVFHCRIQHPMILFW